MNFQAQVEELAALLGPILIKHGDRDVLHIKRQRVAVDHQQQARHQDQQPQRERVSPDLAELLVENGEEASHGDEGIREMTNDE